MSRTWGLRAWGELLPNARQGGRAQGPDFGLDHTGLLLSWLLQSPDFRAALPGHTARPAGARLALGGDRPGSLAERVALGLLLSLVGGRTAPSCTSAQKPPGPRVGTFVRDCRRKRQEGGCATDAVMGVRGALHGPPFCIALSFLLAHFLPTEMLLTKCHLTAAPLGCDSCRNRPRSLGDQSVTRAR